MFDFTELAIGTERPEQSIPQRPPVAGLRISLGKNEFGEFARGRATAIGPSHLSLDASFPPQSAVRPCYPEPSAKESLQSWRSIADSDVIVM
jgi:hypothetical protein